VLGLTGTQLLAGVALIAVFATAMLARFVG
jgi:hypothetical protein